MTSRVPIDIYLRGEKLSKSFKEHSCVFVLWSRVRQDLDTHIHFSPAGTRPKRQ